MTTEAALQTGLTSDPKYIPVWYRYDKAGSIYNDKCLTDNTFYYFHNADISILKNNIEDILPQGSSTDIVLVDMGSGNSEKTRTFIDALLNRQKTLKYIPVDISEDFLADTAKQLAERYGHRLAIHSIPGDYDVGIHELGSLHQQKLIIWLGGGFQNQSYEDQVRRLQLLSTVMTGDIITGGTCGAEDPHSSGTPVLTFDFCEEKCRLIISLDVTREQEAIENAYLDPTGISANLYLNAIWRLNREYGCDIDTGKDKMSLEAEYVRNDSSSETSYVMMYVRVLEDQIHNIPGLGMTLQLSANERVYLHEGKGISCKYTIQQIQTLASRGGHRLAKHWTDADQHVAICCFST